MKSKIVYILIIILFIILIGFLYYNKKHKTLSYYTITYENAKKMINEKDVTIIDVRTEAEYNRGHVKNAISVPLNSIDNLIRKKFKSNKYYIVYCASGVRSRKAAKKLSYLGYKHIYDLGSVHNRKEELTTE